MALAYNADEICGIAVELERNGYKFYMRAAQQFENESARSVLQTLADWELKHEQLFIAMREEIAAEGGAPQDFDPDGEVGLYLKSIADGHVFDLSLDPSQALSGCRTMADVLTIAVGLEKDAIIFYLGLRDLVPQKLGRDRIEGIVQEEMKHVRILSDELAKVRE